MTEGGEQMGEDLHLETPDYVQQEDTELVDNLVSALKALIDRAKEKTEPLAWFQDRLKEALSACLPILKPLQPQDHRLCVSSGLQLKWSPERKSKLRAELEEHGAKPAAITHLESWLVIQSNRDFKPKDEFDSGMTINQLRPAELNRHLSDGARLSMSKLRGVPGLATALINSLLNAFVSAGYIHSKTDLKWSYDFTRKHGEILL